MSNSELQMILMQLEDYKRALGRRFDKEKSIDVFAKYNNVENGIDYLVKEHGCFRVTSRPYKLKLSEVPN